MRVLIVDNDSQIREVLSIALDRVGLEPLAVADGPSALREAQRSRPDLMVLDIGLPHMDWLEVCRRVRAQSSLPILFLTAQAEEVDRIVGLELGGDDYMAKSPSRWTRSGPGCARGRAWRATRSSTCASAAAPRSRQPCAGRSRRCSCIRCVVPGRGVTDHP